MLIRFKFYLSVWIKLFFCFKLFVWPPVFFAGLFLCSLSSMPKIKRIYFKMKSFSFFAAFLFLSFSLFSYEISGITDSRYRTGVEIPFLPCQINFSSGPSGSTLGWSNDPNVVSVGSSVVLAADSGTQGNVLFLYSSASSNNPVSISFSITEPGSGGGSGGDEGGSGGDEGGSGGGEGGSGGGTGGGSWALESTLQQTNSFLNEIKTSVFHAPLINDLWNMAQVQNQALEQNYLPFVTFSTQKLTSIDSNLSSVEDSLSDISLTVGTIYERLGVVSSAVASINNKADTTNVYLLRMSRGLETLSEKMERVADAVESLDDAQKNSQGSLEDHEKPDSLTFSSPALNSIKAKLVPRYNFFGTISGDSNISYDFVFSFDGITDASPGIRVRWVETPSRSSQSLDFRWFWDFISIIRTLLKVLIVYYFLKTVIITIKAL